MRFKTMRFKATCVTGSPAASIGARAINRLGLIAAMMIYGYSPPLRAMEKTLDVTIDQARVVNVPAGTEALVVGNAANVTLLKQGGVIVITGKGFGETNFVALDGAGTTAKLGDDPKYFGEVVGQVKDHNAQPAGLQ